MNPEKKLAASACLRRAAGDLMDEELAAELVAAAHVIVRQAGEWVYAEGDEATGLTVILEGVVQIHCGTPDGLSRQIGVASAGSVLGQTANLGGGPRLHTMICSSPTTIARIPDAAIIAIASRRPEMWKVIVHLLYQQLQGVLRILVQNIALPPGPRVAARLAMLAERDGNVSLDQAGLADALGLSRKTVNGHLTALEREGLIRTGYRRIEVLDGRSLRQKAHVSGTE